MRPIAHTRKLTDAERHLAETVFGQSINYDKVIISDGLGGGDRPYTLPAGLAELSRLVTVDDSYSDANFVSGDFLINVGDWFSSMMDTPKRKDTLIHELTHVWQGQNDYKSTFIYGIIGLLNQATGGDPYKYDHKHLHSSWDLYGMEQQAQIVEDWFHDGKVQYDPSTKQGDIRFYFIKSVIRREKVDDNWILPQVRVLPAATLAHNWSEEPDAIRARLDSVVLPIIRVRYSASDADGPARRVNKLADVFAGLTTLEAANLLKRLQTRPAGDEVARDIHDNLAAVSVNRLTTILKTKAGAALR